MCGMRYHGDYYLLYFGVIINGLTDKIKFGWKCILNGDKDRHYGQSGCRKTHYRQSYCQKIELWAPGFEPICNSE